MGYRNEEKMREFVTRIEQLEWERDGLRRRIDESEAVRKKAETDSASWRRKIVALSDHYQGRVHQLAKWAERLGKERAKLAEERDGVAEERDRLLENVEGLRAENADLEERLSRVRTETLTGFLGTALEGTSGQDHQQSLEATRAREEHILKVLNGEIPDQKVKRTGT